jgi:hypothetical protein
MAIDANLGFVSSVTLPANLGGVAPYDALCNSYASDAGINNASGNQYVAWMSTASSSATSRLTGTGGIRRMDGAPFALSKGDLLAGSVRNPIALDEHGNLIPAVSASVWTGTNINGTSNTFDCSGWTTNANVGLNRGLVFGGPDYWTDGFGGHTCDNTNTRILCFGRTSNTLLSTGLPPSGSKRIGLVGPVARPTSIANADSTCAAAFANSRAVLAGVGTQARDVLTDTTTYVRFDGTVVGTGAEIKNAAISMRSGVWQLIAGAGSFVRASTTMYMWTGSGAAGTTATTCSNWGSSSGTAVLGFLQVTSPNVWNHGGFQSVCSSGSFMLLCAEQ